MHRRRPILPPLLTPVARASGPEGNRPDRLLILVALPLVLSGSSLAQSPPVTIDANLPPPTTFTHYLPVAEFPERIRSIAFAPDREVLYVHYTVRVIDAWSLLVHYWPELLGGVVAVATLLLLIVAWRIRRRTQTKGAPHCRRCNYDLSPQIARDTDNRFAVPDGSRCPECGVILTKRRPIRGRLTVRRVAPLLVTWLTLAGAYGAMHLAGLPRDGRASTWYDLSSSLLAEFATDRNIAFLRPRVVRGDRIVEVRLATGETARTVATRRSETWSELAVTPDGAGLILRGDEFGTLQLISTRTGRRLARVTLPEPDSPLASRNRSVIGFSPDGTTAYVQWAGRVKAICGVSAWNLRTGELSTVAQTASYIDHSIAPPAPYGRPFLLRGGVSTGPAQFLSIPSFIEAYSTEQFILRFHDQPSTGDERPLPINPSPDPSQDPALSSDGCLLFVVSQLEDEIFSVDLQSREIVATLSSGGASHRFHSHLLLSNDSRLLLVGAYPATLLVRDINTERWLAALQYPADLYAPTPSISPDNRWVAAIVQGPSNSTGFRHELVIWNLAEILANSQHAQSIDTESP